MSENRRGKDKRFYFSGGQLVLLGAAFTVASAVIFLSGMLVGKTIEGRKLVKPAEPLIRVPVAPSPQASGGAAVSPGKDELTFYDTLVRDGASARSPRSGEAAPRAATPAAAAPRPRPRAQCSGS